MSKIEAYEQDVLAAFEMGILKSAATKADLEMFKAVARATAVNGRKAIDQRPNLDAGEIQCEALETAARGHRPGAENALRP